MRKIAILVVFYEAIVALYGAPSFVANLTDMDRLVAIITEVCQSLRVGYKDDADGPKGKFHRYESKDGGIRAAITATPPQLVIIVQTKAFGASDTSPMTAAIWK